MKYLQNLIYFLMTWWTHCGKDKRCKFFFFILYSLFANLFLQYWSVKYHSAFAVFGRFEKALLISSQIEVKKKKKNICKAWISFFQRVFLVLNKSFTSDETETCLVRLFRFVLFSVISDCNSYLALLAVLPDRLRSAETHSQLCAVRPSTQSNS